MNFPFKPYSPDPSQVVLVGNGPSLKGSGLGREIESFGQVVRFNRYVIDGYEEDVGGRTDHWITHECLCLHPDYFQIPVPCPKKVTVVCPKVKSTEGDVWERCMEKLPYWANLIPEAIADWATEEFGENKWASTGMLAIAWFCSIGGCTICGFDNFLSNRHHYGDDGQFCGCHNGIKERDLINHLESSGLVRRL